PMSAELQERLNRILPTITSDDFLSGAGIGNEIGFYIFDYPPEEELVVREHVRSLMEQIPKAKPGLKVSHVNLFDLVLEYLRGRNLLDRSLQMQREKGNEALVKALRAALHENKIAEVFEQVAHPKDNDLVLVSGVGTVWPLIRSHTLLNNLHPIMGET